MKLSTTKKLLLHNGQGLVEYVIISSLIGILCLVAVKKYGEVVETRLNWMRSKITENITK